MKSKKILISILFVLVVIVCYFFYQFYFLPKTIKSAVPTEIPFYNIYYVYSINSKSPVSVLWGTKELGASSLGPEIVKDMKKIKEMGFDGVKISYHFKENNYISDRIVLKITEQGLQPIGILMGHNTKPTDRAFTYEEMEEWETFVQETVRNNKDRVYYWEVWNEPDIDMFRYGTPEEYLNLLKTTYTIIKKENPQAKIIATLDAVGLDQSVGDFTEKLLALGGGDYFDIMSFYPYNGNPYIKEDLFYNRIQKQKELVGRYNNRWPLMISEIGQPASQVSEEEQSRLAKIVFEECSKDKIPLVWLYYSDALLFKGAQLGDGSGWGLIRDDDTIRPIFDTITNLIK
ncbi:MAG TPA: hypothetical protein PLD14_02940 [Candidatus Pacearchaeota archaeon]|nr:hypothetical protein [Candidatus Pacearchaeota archaeon]HPR80155.1 hypothetical protein [Candidatus Pacearchaeota archaeon]